MILHLKDFGISKARREHPALRGKRVLARGTFSAIFEGASPASVLKLTVDPAQYAYMTDGLSPDGQLKPVLLEDHSQIGETSSGEDVFLIEVERLAPLARGAEGYRVMRRVLALYARNGHKLLPEDPAEVKGMTQLMSSFFAQINWFCINFGYRIDAAMGQNYMQRTSDGSLVASDPVFDAELMTRHRKPAYL